MRGLDLLIQFFLITISFFFSSNILAQQPQDVGGWSEPVPFGIVPVAVANLPDGKLITWSSKAKLSFGGRNGFTYYEIFDPFQGIDGEALGEKQTVTNHDMFCPGINNLYDGRLLVAGGSSSERATFYDYKTDTWSKAQNMNVPRGYQGNVTLSDGSIFTIGGSWSGLRGGKLAEIWTPNSGWEELIGVPGNTLFNQNDSVLEPEGIFRLDNHAWLWAAPNGKVFHAGPGEIMNWIDVNDGGSVISVGKRGDDDYSMKGTTVMYDIGKILKVGGATNYAKSAPAKDNSYVIDINDETNVTVTPTVNKLNFSRTMHNSVVLPNGKVLVVGGLSKAIAFSDAGARLTGEMYNPETNNWSNVAGMQIPRTYHSVAILMLDGRVFVGGGGLCGDCPVNHPNAEIYSPPYLFDDNGGFAIRPDLDAPETASNNSQLSVSSNSDIVEFSFIRMSSATHSTNNEQRRIPVAFEKNGTNYNLNVPGANLLPPGYYMLFAIDDKGVPSIAETVKVGALNIIPENPRDPDGNIAYRRPTAQSSTYIHGGNSARAVDGIVDGRLDFNSVTHTLSNSNSWWRVDLGKEYDLSSIKIFNRTDCCSERLDGAKVYVGNTPSSIPSHYQQVAVLNSNIQQTFTSNLGKGRYVMIKHDRNEYLSLAEVQVFGEPVIIPLINVALNKNTSQSSDYLGSPSSFKAVDGNTNGTSEGIVTHTLKELNAWWRVDLGGNYNISRINIFNRTDCCSNRLNTAEVYVGGVNSTDPSDYTKISSLGSNASYAFNNLTVNGRYVMVRLSGTDFLSLAEVQVFGEPVIIPLINVALNKNTSQSSDYLGSPSSFKAVDGNTNGTSEGIVTHTLKELNAWWRVDLGGSYNISRINIFNRTDCCSNRLNTAEVYVGGVNSTDPSDYTKISSLGSNTSYAFNNLTVNGRYVMVRLSGTDFLSLAEVQVFGEPVITPLINVALNKNTSQSSDYLGSPSSFKAVDGNTNGTSEGTVTHTLKELNAWWRVDLGGNYNISRINIFNRTDCCSNRLNTAEVYVGEVNSTDPSDYTKISSLGSNASYAFNNLTVNGHYVMVRLSGTDFLSLAEVEVFGELTTTPLTITETSESPIDKEPLKSFDSVLEGRKLLKANDVYVFPNPTVGGIFNINLNSNKIKGNLTLSAFNASGQQVFEKYFAKEYVAVEAFNMGKFPSGNYFVVISSEAGVITKQVIIRR